MNIDIVGNSIELMVPTRYDTTYRILYKTTDHAELIANGIPIIASEYEAIMLDIANVTFMKGKVSMLFHIFNSPNGTSSISVDQGNSIENCIRVAKQIAYKEFSFYKEKE